MLRALLLSALLGCAATVQQRPRATVYFSPTVDMDKNAVLVCGYDATTHDLYCVTIDEFIGSPHGVSAPKKAAPPFDGAALARWGWTTT